MATTPQKPPTTIRDLMPESYLAKLMELSGNKNYSNLAHIVRSQHTTSKFWPAVLQLAEETNPEGYAQWAAANPDKLRAQPVALAEQLPPAPRAGHAKQPALAQAA